MAYFNFSRVIMEMGNRQLQTFLRGMTGPDLSNLIYCLKDSAQDKIYKNMSVKAITHLQILVEKLKQSGELPQVSEEVKQKIMECYERKSSIALPVLASDYTVHDLVKFISEVKNYINENGYKDFSNLIESIPDKTIGQLLAYMTKYDNALDYENMIDIIMERRLEELKTQNKILKHGFLQLFNGDAQHLNLELENMIPFNDKITKGNLEEVIERRTILEAKEED